VRQFYQGLETIFVGCGNWFVRASVSVTVGSCSIVREAFAQ
jgi:hypothetical protein